MSKAPSEKHLEDYLWAHPEALNPGNWDVETCGNIFYPYYRQLRLPSGVPDLVGEWFIRSICIIELKKGEINTKAFAQLMRYMRDFKSLIDAVLSKYREEGKPNREYMPRHPIIHHSWSDTLLKGILIGNSISDEHLLMACHACNVEVFTYDYADGRYTFSQDLSERRAVYDNEKYLLENTEDLPDLIDALIEDELIMNSRLDHARRFSAVSAAEKHLGIDGKES